MAAAYGLEPQIQNKDIEVWRYSDPNIFLCLQDGITYEIQIFILPSW